MEARLLGGKIAARHLVPRDILIEDRGKVRLMLHELRHPKINATAHGVRLFLYATQPTLPCVINLIRELPGEVSMWISTTHP